MQGGPQLSWGQLTGSRSCASAAACAVFKDRHPSTVAMTVLVVVEMFNALNALSENNSLLQVSRAVPALRPAAPQNPCAQLQVHALHAGSGLQETSDAIVSEHACKLVKKRASEGTLWCMLW